MIALACLLAVSLSQSVHASPDATRLTLVPEGGSERLAAPMSQRAAVRAERPAGVVQEPAGLAAPRYGTLSIGDGFLFILDEPTDRPCRLYVDTNRNGDFTDDPPATWEVRELKQGDRTVRQHHGTFRVDIGPPGTPVLVAVKAFRTAAAAPEKRTAPDMLTFHRDYVYEGRCQVGSDVFPALLADEQTRGTFTGAGVMLFLDLNGDGRFDADGEGFPVGRPMNIRGIAWDVADMARDGSSFRMVRSTAPPPPVSTNPALAAGQPFPSFEATDTDGHRVRFPEDYRSKFLLIDFWATWCAPCMAEMPNLVAAYEKYHERGFEILGVSLDSDSTITRMPDALRKHRMTWRQVADGKGWRSTLAERFAIRSIPAAYLVDGSTGIVLAAKVRGPALESALSKAVAERDAPPRTPGGSERPALPAAP